MKKKPVKRISKTTRARPVLAADETPAFRVENLRGRGNGIIIGDHTSNRVPRALKDMGLKKTELKKHIGWDIGTEDLCRHISRELDMPAVLAGYSRLVVDLNRAPGHPECVPETSCDIKIPANTALSRDARERRLKELYWPYQNHIGKLTDRYVRKGQVPVLIAVHSFTPILGEVRRPWHMALLWSREEKIAKRLVSALRKDHPDLLIGENEPYTLFNERFEDSTISRHGEERNLPYVLVEFRQDLVNTKEKAIHWADIFLRALKPVLANPEIYMDRKIKPRKK